MPGYVSIYDGLLVAHNSIESFQLNYRQIKSGEKIYKIEVVFKSGHTVKFEELSEDVYNEIIDKLKTV